MIELTVYINGKSAKCCINPNAKIKHIKEYICNELDLNSEDYYIAISNKNEDTLVDRIVNSTSCIHVIKNIVVSKDDFIKYE